MEVGSTMEGGIVEEGGSVMEGRSYRLSPWTEIVRSKGEIAIKREKLRLKGGKRAK